jgi:hypothetical protein
MAEPKKALSASRIKTLQSCSWTYYCNYIINVPQRQNEGALRGTICHTIFEILLKPRHKKHYDGIISVSHIMGSRGVDRLIQKLLKKDKILDDESYDLVNDMILVGLKYDFFCEGGEITNPEYEFSYSSEKPRFKVTGYMDKPAIYKHKAEVIITDYKSSKKKFTGEDLSANVQAMLYSLAAKKLWPELKPIIRFLFLRFPRAPIQQLSFTDSQLRGFAYSLEELNEIVDNFDEKAAKKHFAADNPSYSWMCGRGSYVCPFKHPVDYFILVDETGKLGKSAFDKSLLKPKPGQAIVSKRYTGCPRHYKIDNTI